MSSFLLSIFIHPLPAASFPSSYRYAFVLKKDELPVNFMKNWVHPGAVNED
jgi:hypothetical protein